MMTTQARSLNQTQLIQQRRHQSCLKDNTVNHSSRDSHLDISQQQHHSQETHIDKMMIEDDERQKNVTPESIVYDNQHNSHHSTSEINSDESEQQSRSTNNNTNKDQTMQQQRPPSQQEENICAGCNKAIKDRFLLEALDKHWHEDCLKCAGCGCRLGELGSSLFINAGKILCKHDFLRIFGDEGCCAACKKSIPPYEMVMRANKNAYHMDCFACQQCNYRFCVGDKFHLQDDHKIICLLCQCENDSHLSSQTSGSSFSQSNNNFTSSQESVYEHNQQQFNSHNQSNNDASEFQRPTHNQQQSSNRSRQPSDMQHCYHVAKAQSIISSTKNTTSNHPQPRLNNMVLNSNSNIIHGSNGMNNSMMLDNEMHFMQHTNHFQNQPTYRPQFQVMLNQHGIPLAQQQNLPRSHLVNNFNIPSNNHQHQPRTLSYAHHNPNQHIHQHSHALVTHTKQVILHHQPMEPTLEYHMHQQVNGANMQQRNHYNHHQHQMQQPTLSTIHHRAPEYDASLVEQQHHQLAHSNQDVKQEMLGTQSSLFEACPTATNGEQARTEKDETLIDDNIVDIATTTASNVVTNTALTTHATSEHQDHDGHYQQQQIYKNDEPLPAITTNDISGKVADDLQLDTKSSSSSKLEQDMMLENVARVTAIDCNDDDVGADASMASESRDQAVTISMKQQQQPDRTQVTNSFKKRKTKDESGGGGILHARTIEALLRGDPDNGEPNTNSDEDEMAKHKQEHQQQQETSESRPIIDNVADNSATTKEEAGNLQQQEQQQQDHMSNPDPIDQRYIIKEERVTTNISESSVSISNSSETTPVGESQQLQPISS